MVEVMPQTSIEQLDAKHSGELMRNEQDIEYVLEDQIGFIIRLVGQRHTNVFSSTMPSGLTPTQFSALVKLREAGPCSQNHLGRMTAIDVATIKGVVERLKKRGLVRTYSDKNDKRRLLIEIIDTDFVDSAIKLGTIATANTLSPLSKTEQKTLLRLLKRLR